jgi:hypothetical protein
VGGNHVFNGEGCPFDVFEIDPNSPDDVWRLLLHRLEQLLDLLKHFRICLGIGRLEILYDNRTPRL